MAETRLPSWASLIGVDETERAEEAMTGDKDNRERLRVTFEGAPELYDRVRPRYPNELVDDLIALAGLPEQGRILEIGAGTGIATLPLAERGYQIVAVELGTNLAAVARRKLANFGNVEVVVSAFEELQLPEEPFDLVMSATAWHWVDPSVGYRKAAEALHSDGALAVFGYWHVGGGDQEFFERVQRCYVRFMPGSDSDVGLQDPASFASDTSALEQSGLFEKRATRTYLSAETYSRVQYLDLLSTYSGHRALNEEARKGLFDCIGGLIDTDFGGRIRKQYLHELVVAGRKNAEPPR
jgi:SAM-dependent methyltransferase